MAVIKWSVNYEIGLPSIDVQHRRLADRYNELVTRKRDGAPEVELVELLDVLMGEVADHCGTEEEAMERAGYPGLEEHRGHHRDLAERMDRFRTVVGLGRQQIDDSALLFTRHWLLNHIVDSDIDFGRFQTERGAAQPVGA